MTVKKSAGGKLKVGRPSKYSQMMLEKAQLYLDTYKSQGDLVPTVVGLALALGVATNTIYNWVAAEVSAEFLSVFTRIEQIQHQGLVNGGLAGTFNPAITKMMLTKHGYNEKQEVEHSGGVTITKIVREIVRPENQDA